MFDRCNVNEYNDFNVLILFKGGSYEKETYEHCSRSSDGHHACSLRRQQRRCYNREHRGTGRDQAQEETTEEAEAPAEDAGEEAEAEAASEDFHIGIVTGSVSQSEDDRRGAEAFQAKYGEENVTLAIYPDNFTEEQETTIQTIVNLSDDPKMKAASQVSPTRIFPRSAPLQIWLSTTTS